MANGRGVEAMKSLRSGTFGSLREYLVAVARALGDRQSFYCLDLGDVIEKVETWRVALPDVRIYYAVKANPDPVLLQLLVLMGVYFDCATEGEIEAVLEAGAHPSTILWAHTVKPAEGLLYARSVGVDAMTFDDEHELRKIHTLFPTARLLLRIRPSLVKCRFDLSSKFGCSKAQAERLLTLARHLGMDVLGISFHVGALCTDPACFSTTIRDCRDLFEYAQTIGSSLSVLDIGGGFFGAKGTEPIFKKIAEGINAALKEYFSDTPVRVIAEPGCYVVGSAVNLVCTVIGKRDVEDQGTTVSRHYFLNNGIYGSFFRDIESYDIRATALLSDRPEVECALFGQTCCSEDVIARSCRLPELEIGDCVLWENMGAYSSAICSTFCGVPLPLTVYVFQRLQPSGNLVREFLERHAVCIRGQTPE